MSMGQEYQPGTPGIYLVVEYFEEFFEVLTRHEQCVFTFDKNLLLAYADVISMRSQTNL